MEHNPKTCVCAECCAARLAGKPQKSTRRPKTERKAISKANSADRTHLRPWARRRKRREAADLAMLAMMERGAGR